MAQFVRPISDLDNTGVWTTAPLWSKIDDSVGSGDADFVTSDGNPTASETFTVDGSTVTDPASSINHILRVRASEETGGANHDIIVELRQGYVSEASLGTLIATLTASAIANTPTTYTHTLTGGEADSITNYGDLQFRVYAQKNGGGAGNAVTCYDIELEVPDAGNIYDESISVTSNTTVSKNNNIDFIGDTTINSNATVNKNNNIDFIGDTTINANATVSNGNNNVIDTSFAFTSLLTLLQSGGLNIEDSLSFSSQLSLVSNVNLELNEGVLLLSNAVIDKTNEVGFNAFFAIASVPTIFTSNDANVDNSVSLQSILSFLTSGGSVFDGMITMTSDAQVNKTVSIGLNEATSITANVTVNKNSDAFVGNSININSDASISKLGNINLDATFTLLLNALLSSSGGAEFEDAFGLSLNTTTAFLINALFNTDVNLNSDTFFNYSNNIVADNNTVMSIVVSLNTDGEVPSGGNIYDVTITLSNVTSLNLTGLITGAPQIVIKAKVPFGKALEDLILGSYKKNKVIKGKFVNFDIIGYHAKENEKKGKEQNNVKDGTTSSE